MSKQKAIRVMVFLCVVVFAAIALFACSPADDNQTQLTPTPTISPTPTPLFRDPVISDPEAKAEPLLPTFLGIREKVWDLAREIPIEQARTSEGKTTGWFRFLWQEDAIYVLVHVSDDTPDTSAEDVHAKDAVFVYINEDGRKNLRYTVGDAFYAVDRDGVGYLGRGGTEEGYYAITFPDETGEGYYAEFRIPLLSITGRYDREIGFDVCITNALDGELIHAIQWADVSGYTENTMTGVGTVRFD